MHGTDGVGARPVVRYEERSWWQAVLDLDDLRELRELFRSGRQDAAQVPFGLSFAPGHRSFPVTTEDELRAVRAFLDAEVTTGRALQGWLVRDEIQALRAGSVVACAFNSVTNRAIH